MKVITISLSLIILPTACKVAPHTNGERTQAVIQDHPDDAMRFVHASSGECPSGNWNGGFLFEQSDGKLEHGCWTFSPNTNAKVEVDYLRPGETVTGIEPKRIYLVH